MTRVVGPSAQTRGVFVWGEMEFFPLELEEGNGHLSDVPYPMLPLGRVWGSKRDWRAVEPG